jgi:hypothetical protein
MKGGNVEDGPKRIRPGSAEGGNRAREDGPLSGPASDPASISGGGRV